MAVILKTVLFTYSLINAPVIRMKAIIGLTLLLLLAGSVMLAGIIAEHYTEKARIAEQEQFRLLAIQERKCQLMWPKLGDCYGDCLEKVQQYYREDM